MAILKDTTSDASTLLRARHLVGRAPGVDLTIDRPEVSREHATIAWASGGWEVRDLGSRNGTWVDDVHVSPGEGVPLRRGSVVRFGSHRTAWVLEDAAPPNLAASNDGVSLEAIDGMLMLPDATDPEVVVHHEPGVGWVVERNGACESVRDRDVLRVGGVSWRLHIPRTAEPTESWSPNRSINHVSMSFAVSADEEYIELTLTVGGESHKLAPRAHHELLLTLARARLEDAEQGGVDAEHGWLYTDDLQRMLGASANQLYVQIHRARREFEALELAGATTVVQRRPTTRQVRLGVGDVTIASI